MLPDSAEMVIRKGAIALLRLPKEHRTRQLGELARRIGLPNAIRVLELVEAAEADGGVVGTA